MLPTRAFRLAAALALGASIPLAACSRGAAPPSILLVTFDTTRADRLSCYGASSPQTPNIDSVAARGILFEDATTPVPVTAPAMTSLMTGLYPYEHGVRNNGSFRLVDGVPTLAEALRAAGYRTGAVLAAHVLEARFGLARGFDSYDDRFTAAERDGAIGRRAGEVSRRGIEFLDGLAKGDRFFLWLHYYDAHGIYDPPSPFRERFANSPYEGEIAYADDAFGAVLRQLDSAGRTDSTFVVVTADHGEGLAEHGETSHGVFLYQSTVHVPLVLAGPGVPSGGREARPVSLIDVAPTILARAGAASARGFRGSGVDLLRPRGDAKVRDLYLETAYPRLNFGWAGLRAVRSEREKYIAAPRPELYDLSNDPREEKSLAEERSDRKERLAERLAAFPSTSFDEDPMGARIDVDSESRARLEALGYVSIPGAARARSADDAKDPKDMIGLLDTIDLAATDLRAGRFEAAAEKLRGLLEKSPGNSIAHFQLGEALMRLEKFSEAEAEFESALASEPGFVEARLRRGVCRQLRRELGLAEADYRTAIEADPRFSSGYFHLGLLLKDRGDAKGAADALQKAVDLAPLDAVAWAALGDALLATGDKVGAEEAYYKGVEADPKRLDLMEKARRLQQGGGG